MVRSAKLGCAQRSLWIRTNPPGLGYYREEGLGGSTKQAMDKFGSHAEQAEQWLRGALGLASEENIFPWQLELLRCFLRGDKIQALDVPTGLGKTATIGIWLVARALGAPLPCRLVYVVDRRAVVDQATEVAISLRHWVAGEALVAKKLGLRGRPLAISTLRGQFVDNREWLEDPSAPAIVLGTVDMVGSRLLFSGYGVSTKMRPYHAGLLGADTLMVLDEAHLAPAFEDLLRQVEGGSDTFGPKDPSLRTLIPKFTLLSLSATGRETGSASLTLTDADHRDPVVSKRLNAKKSLTTVALPSESKLADELANQAWRLTQQGSDPIRCLIFCNARKDAIAIANRLRNLAKSTSAPETTVELFVGARRVRERTKAREALVRLGFLAGDSPNLEQTVFLVATSAGEVGVDLDADHMICDLVAWERMVQRLGRVNRRGDGDARVVIVIDSEPVASKTLQTLQGKRDRATRTRREILSRRRQAGPDRAKLQRAIDDAQSGIEQLDRQLTHHRDAKPGGRKTSEQKEAQQLWKESLQQLKDALENKKRDRKENRKKLSSLEKSLATSKDDKAHIAAFKHDDAKLVARYEAEVARHRALCKMLTAVGPGGSLSSAALLQLKNRPNLVDALRDAASAEPLRPELTRPLVDAWSMTSLDEHPGRPGVDPWLRGFRPNDPPYTTLVWRRHLPVRKDSSFDKKAAKRFFADAPPHTSEQLETETPLALDWLIKRAAATDDSSVIPESVVAIALTSRGDVKDCRTIKQLRAASSKDKASKDGAKEAKKQLKQLLIGATLIIDTRLAGLTDDLLEDKASATAEAADDPNTVWLARSNTPGVPVTGFRIRQFPADDQEALVPTSATAHETGWVQRHVFVTEEADGKPLAGLIIDGWVGDPTTEDERASSNRPQKLEEHQNWADACAREIAKRLRFDEKLSDLLALAARLHDEGKRAQQWQRAFNAPINGRPYAKTRGPINFAMLDGYRHELGSLPYVEQHGEFLRLPSEDQELVLHLIAAHHGYARPVIGTSGCDDAPPSLVDERAREVALRFARLSERWGPWGLAWWEALLRAADQAASRRNQQTATLSVQEEQT